MQHLYWVRAFLLFGIITLINSCAGTPAGERAETADSSNAGISFNREHAATLAPVQGEPMLRLDSGGHLAHIFDICFTRDGKRLVSAGEDKTVRVWDLDAGLTSRTILGSMGSGLEGVIYAMALSPDEKTLAVGGRLAGNRGQACSIRLHDFETGNVIRLLTGHSNVVNDLDFSPDQKHLASASSDGTIRLWDFSGSLDNPAVLRGHEGYIYQARFSPDGRSLVSASDDRTLSLWNVRDGSRTARLSGHQDVVRAAAWSPDGRFIVSGSRDNLIKVWDGKDGRFIKDLVRLDRAPAALEFTPDGKALIAGCEQGAGPYSVKTLEFPSGRIIDSFDRHDGEVLAAAVSPDGRMIASAGGESFPIFVRRASGGEDAIELTGEGRAVDFVGISLDGTEAVFRQGAGPDRVIRLRDDNGWGISFVGEADRPDSYLKAEHELGRYSLKVQDDAVLQVLMDGRLLASISRDASNGGRHSCYGLTPDYRAVISGGENGRLTAYDPHTGREIGEFVGHESEILSLTVSSDGRRMVTGSSDQTIRLWNLDRLGLDYEINPFLTIFPAKNGEWVAWTGQGYYSCSLKGDRLTGWVVNHGLDEASVFFPAERFAGQLYRPDLVSAVLQTGDIEAALAMAGKQRPAGAQVDLTRFLPPEISVIQPKAARLATTSPFISIKALAQSVTNEPVKEFVVLHEGRPVHEASRGESGDDGFEGFLEGKIKLNPGLNSITLSAANRFARSNPVELSVRFIGRPSDIPAEKPELYVLAVGVSKYMDEKLNLNFARQDAESIAEFFSGQKGGVYKQVHIKTLLDEEAVRDGIESNLAQLMEKTKPNDLAVLFLAGHGRDNGRGDYYFLSHDASLEDQASLGVSWHVFREFLTKTPSRVILMADTCRSGGITGSRRLDSDMTGALKEIVASGTGVAVLAASTGREDSKESPKWGHGAFTLAVLEGLKGGADYNHDNMIDLFELNLYVTHRVVELTGGSQRPTVEIPASAPSFTVALGKGD